MNKVRPYLSRGIFEDAKAIAPGVPVLFELVFVHLLSLKSFILLNPLQLIVHNHWGFIIF